MSSNGRAIGLAATLCVLMLGVLAESVGQEATVGERGRALRGSFGTYAGEPRTKDGHVDIERLVSELAELKANTYHWLIWHRETDWEDLQRFLPLARQENILVWVCLVLHRTVEHPLGRAAV
jgi:hypothetical protein